MTLQYVDIATSRRERYPFNPNGSPLGLGRAVQRRRARHLGHAAPRAGVSHACRTPGRREEWGEDGGWMRLFRNARVFVG